MRSATGAPTARRIIRVFGRVTFVYPAGAFFTLWDGTNWTGVPLQDSDGNPGVRIKLASGASAPALNSFVTVTGLSGSYSANARLWPIVRTRSAADVQPQ